MWCDIKNAGVVLVGVCASASVWVRWFVGSSFLVQLCQLQGFKPLFPSTPLARLKDQLLVFVFAVVVIVRRNDCLLFDATAGRTAGRNDIDLSR